MYNTNIFLKGYACKIKDKGCCEEAVKVCSFQIKIIIFNRLLITFAVHVVETLIIIFFL